MKLNSAGLGFVFYTMPSTLLSAPSWSLWQMVETRHCVRVYVWHLRFLSLYLRVYWCNVKQKKVTHHFNTIFLSKLQGVMTVEVNKKKKRLRLQHSQRSKEKRKSRTGSIDEGIGDKKSLLPSRHFPLCLEITPRRFSSHFTQIAAQTQPDICADSNHLPLSALPNAHSSWRQGDRIFKLKSSWS